MDYRFDMSSLFFGLFVIICRRFTGGATFPILSAFHPIQGCAGTSTFIEPVATHR